MLEERSIEFSASAKTKGTGKETNIGSRVDKKAARVGAQRCISLEVQQAGARLGSVI